MSKLLPILSILILFSCDKLLQNKQMYSVEITSCLFKDGDFNRSNITRNPLPVFMYVYENEFLIWKAKLPSEWPARLTGFLWTGDKNRYWKSKTQHRKHPYR